MEPQQQQQQQLLQENTNSSGSGSKSSSYLCRQSSTRWNPTTEQIRILKELYHKNGVRSPNAEQIQTICARLRQYGKIEGKNVFYWFQNHKARERQKKRYTVDIGMQRGWKREDSFPTKYCNMGFSSPSSSSSPQMVGIGQMGSSGYGSGLMERSFRECSISGGGGGYMGKSSVGRVGLQSPASSPCICLGGKKGSSATGGNMVEAEGPAHMQTLQLFPVHAEEEDHDHVGDGGAETWLGLSLGSYSGGAPDSM